MIASSITSEPERLHALCSLWQRTGCTLTLTLHGQSMTPTLPDGSRIRVRFSRELPALGQVAAYRRGNILVIHRLERFVPTERGEELVFRGDANAIPDPAVPADAVVGVVIGVGAPRLAYRIRRALRHVKRLLAPA